MSEPKSDPKSSSSYPGKEVKAPNVFERVKEEFDAVLHNDHHNETHGLNDDIRKNTFMSDVKAPNVFERAKEEIDAVLEAIHPKKAPKFSSETSNSTKNDHLQFEKVEAQSEKNVKKPNIIEKAKKEIGSLMHKPHHHKETHGTSDDINENTPINEVKGPNVFERAKEEIEALIEAVRPKKDSGNGK